MIDFSRRRATLAIGALAATPFVAGCDKRASARLLTLTGETMAGEYTVKIARPGALSAAAERALAQELFAAIDAVDQGMSTYRPDSELTRLNGHHSETPLPVSNPLADVLDTAREVSAGSNGAFDVTVGGLVDAWGFGPPGRVDPPAMARIATLREQVSWRSLIVDRNAGTVTKQRHDALVDLSGIAQGYGSDRIAAALETRGFGDYMVEVSGEVRARGMNADGVPWRIGIERPDGGPQRLLQYVVPLVNRALATSGDYRNFFERDGRRYSHEIDPASGEPVLHHLGSVTVVFPGCALADAWATALFVLGPQKGVALAREQGIAAYFIVRKPAGELVQIATPAFAALGGRSVDEA
jgi:FAD:protein FMN transferase